MIGIVLTGHGEFAVGLAHALEMIAGPQHSFRVVPFRESDPMEALEANMSAAIKEVRAETDGVVVFSDLLGGSPFKAAMIAAAEVEDVEVVVGTNLPMLIEIAIARQFFDNPLEVVQQSLAAGHDGLQHVVMPTATQEDVDDEDGI